MTTYKVPLIPQAQTFQAQFPNGRYQVRLIYCDVPEGGWIMDLTDVLTGNLIIAGAPLVTGANLLAQYPDLFNFALYVSSDGDPFAVPRYNNLGVSSFLWLVY